MPDYNFDNLIENLGKFGTLLAEKTAPGANELLSISVKRSLTDWFAGSAPKSYAKTDGFFKASDFSETTAKGNVLSFSLSSPNTDMLWERLGITGRQNNPHTYTPDSVNIQSAPDYTAVEKDIKNGFGGRLNKIITAKIEEILRK